MPDVVKQWECVGCGKKLGSYGEAAISAQHADEALCCSLNYSRYDSSLCGSVCFECCWEHWKMWERGDYGCDMFTAWANRVRRERVRNEQTCIFEVRGV